MIKNNKTTLFQIFVFLVCFHSICYAQEQNNKITAPPFMASSANFSIALFNVTQEGAKDILPKGILPKVNENGYVTAGLELYTTARIYGMPKFSIAFIYVEVENMDTKNGAPGHWAVWGKTNNEQVLENLVSHYNFPYEYSPEISIVSQKDGYTGMVSSKEGESIHIQLKTTQGAAPFITEGIVNMCGKKENEDTVLSEVTWFTNGQNAEVISLDVDPGNNKVLQLLKKSEPFWAMVSKEQVFCYSIPIVLNKTN